MPLPRLRLFAAFALSLALTACAHQPQATPAPTPKQALAQLFTDYWEDHLALNPLEATFVGDARYNDRLPNFLAAENIAKRLAYAEKWRARIAAVDTSALDAQDQLSVQIFLRDRDVEIAGAHFPDHLQPIDQFYSMPNLLAQLGSGTSAQPFKTVADYDNWLKRAGQIPPLFTQAIANMREGMKTGVVQPRVLMNKVLPQLDALISDDPTKTLFYKPITDLPATFSAEDKARLTTTYTALISSQLMPAYKGLRSFIAKEYLPKTRRSVGLGALPDGPAWYAYRVRPPPPTSRRHRFIRSGWMKWRASTARCARSSSN